MPGVKDIMHSSKEKIPNKTEGSFVVSGLSFLRILRSKIS
jgi:hypothetical protein